uniref:cytidine deaminase-like fold-containing protein n=1 Tax=Pantoea sp. sgz302252 TaxID=3341827 RepID=UPI0036D321DD
TKSATEALNRAGTKELAAAKTEWQKANPDKTPTQDDIVQQLYQTSYNKAMLDSGKGTGGALQQGISAATAAVSALAGGNLSAAVAGGAAPYLAELIHKATTTKDANGKEVVNVEANLIAHAVLGAAVAQASGGSALAGASGGAAGEYIAQQLYPGVDRKDLSEEQRQTISALGTLAAGLAGGLAGDSAGSAVTGAQAGKNAVENNLLSVTKNEALNKAIEDQKAGRNLLEASQTIVRATNEDRASNVLVGKFLKGTITDSEKQQLAGLLDQYGTELQTVYGYSSNKASDAIRSLLSGNAFVASQADARAYNEALGYLKTYSAQSGQAALGSDALMVLPGVPGTLVRGSVAVGGAYQTGTGIGQISKGEYAKGFANVGLGTAIVLGGRQGNKVVGNIDGSIVSPTQLATQNSSHVLDRQTRTSIPKVTAELTDTITGKTFIDTNQGNRPDFYLGDASRPTLINGRIESKIEKNPGKYLPNGNMASAHAEVGAIQQAFDNGITVGKDMSMRVTKEPVCGYCRGDIAAMADKAGLKSLTVYEESSGKILYWNPGMKSLKEKK